MKKVVIITGSRKGIGRALCETFLSRGHIVAGCSREASDLSHPLYRHFCLDVGDETKVCEMVRATKKEFGTIDILINNAGAASMNHSLTTPLSTLQHLINVNLVGTFLFSRECGKVMMKQKDGRIVNFSTVAVALHLEGEALYGAAKSGVESLTHTMAKELAPFNITVNAIGPTPVATDLIKAIPRDKIEKLLEQQPLKRMGTIEDVQHTVDFLIDPKSSFITSQIIYLGGVF